MCSIGLDGWQGGWVDVVCARKVKNVQFQFQLTGLCHLIPLKEQNVKHVRTHINERVHYYYVKRMTIDVILDRDMFNILLVNRS